MMRRSKPKAVRLSIEIGNSNQPLFAQIRDQIADLVETGQIEPGMRLPPVRMLANQLKINQMTVARAYKDLIDNQLAEGRRGGGTLVRDVRKKPVKQPRSAGIDISTEPIVSERLFELGRAPGVIAFTGNYVDPAEVSLDDFRACLHNAVDANFSLYFRYGVPAGLLELREQISIYLRAKGMVVSPRDFIVTTGAQQAIDLVCRTIVSPGVPVVIERPAYYGAISALRGAGARLIEVPLQSDGMDLDLLEEAFRRHRPALLYTNPTFQNPTGITTSLLKRRRMLALARQYDVLILEDDHCSDMRFEGDAVPSIRALPDTESTVFFAQSMGKTALPGMRLGFLIPPARFHRAILARKASSDLHSGSLIQAALARYFATGGYDRCVKRITKRYGLRQRTLFTALKKAVPAEVEMSRPKGGVSLWLSLPRGVAGTDLYFRAVRQGVAFVAGEAFYASRPDQRTMRISFGLTPQTDLDEGVKRLASVVNDVIESRAGPRWNII